jgi:hypothetical protein
MVKLTFFLLSKPAIFGHLFKKNQHTCFLVHGHSSWSTFGLLLMRGPKALQIEFVKNRDHESWAIKSDHGLRPSSMVRLHDPWCKPTLSISSWMNASFWGKMAW